MSELVGLLYDFGGSGNIDSIVAVVRYFVTHEFAITWLLVCYYLPNRQFLVSCCYALPIIAIAFCNEFQKNSNFVGKSCISVF